MSCARSSASPAGARSPSRTGCSPAWILSRRASARPDRAGGTDGTRARGANSAGAESPAGMSLCDAWSPAASRASLPAAELAPLQGNCHQRNDRRSRRSAASHHQAAPPDEAAGRDDGANHPARRTRRLWEDHPRPRVVRGQRGPSRLVPMHAGIVRRGCTRSRGCGCICTFAGR